MKILLAEDDVNISTIAKMALEHIGGHDVEHVDNGRTALDRALSNSYDVILLDEMMPKLNGLTVCQEYQNQKGNDTPIIFLSAKSQKNDVEDFKKHGLGFIPKPFDPSTLCEQIQALLDSLPKEAGAA